MRPIPPPDPDLTACEMLRRAQSMRERLRSRQQACEAEGRIPEETHREFLEAGFYRALQPRRFGGYEFCVTDFVRLLIEVSRGCSDSGWVLSLIAAQPAGVLSLFPEETQREIYGPSGDCRAAAVIAPAGSAVVTTTGYRVSGNWDYCSGCDIATHFLGNATLLHPLTGGAYGTACVVFDRDEFEIADNWQMMGLQGTGSRRVTVRELTVGANRVLPVAGSEWPLGVAEFALCAVAIGGARGALDAFEDVLKKKWTLPPHPHRFEMPELQQAFGTAQALVDTAEAALTGLAGQWVERGGVAGEDSRRIHRAGNQCIELAWQATDLMFRMAGSSAGSRHSALGRSFRALAVLRTHIGAQYDHRSINIARLHFGLPAASPL